MHKEEEEETSYVRMSEATPRKKRR